MTEKYVNTNSDEVNDLTKVSIVNAGAPPTVSGEKVLFFQLLKIQKTTTVKMLKVTL